MAYLKVWLHLVFGTKNREANLSKEIKEQVITHIKENAKKKDIYIDSINGYKDHLHCIVALHAEQSISDVVHLIKGESSYWINQNKLTTFKFLWAEEYFATSISESQLQNVRNYVAKQEEHHRTKSFAEECEEFFKIYGFKNLG